MNEDINKINAFKKSIESTIRAISRKPNVSILFGGDKENSLQEINLPEISKNNIYENKTNVRGKSDSASLIKRYHNSQVHKKMAPKKENSKEIFNEIEFLRCELIGSAKYPGIKKNLTELDKKKIADKLNENIKLTKPETFKLILKNNLLKIYKD